ncbi:hypothetical protein [Paludibaculum fermentans]|uniref:Flagellar protein FlgJ N-terminal domain-containing protein n=1 Tax=Paludibaculum fermentans TaxID=1473598 RepID=A0A7S7SLV1_PALFE|nr:hypothetical protein [Paludibaculum fermentans]QOY88851.1 hypothetical protein IRI77_02505 [Paludibaculum fermentans]
MNVTSPSLDTSALSSAASTFDGARKADDPKKIRDSAQQFESLLIGQILKEVSAAAQSSGLGEEDAASGSMMEMAQEHLAQAIATRGGFGLTAMVMRGLEAKPSTATKSTNGGPEQLPVAASYDRP